MGEGMTIVCTPEQAQALIGPCVECERCGPSDDRYGGCAACNYEPPQDIVARFVPAETADAFPVGEWIEVVTAVPFVAEDGAGAIRISEPHGSVRLGEPVPVAVEDFPVAEMVCPGIPHVSAAKFDGRVIGLALCDGDPMKNGPESWPELVEDLTPDLALWPAEDGHWSPGTWAYPINDRRTQ